jgi:serine/threonine protein kinase
MAPSVSVALAMAMIGDGYRYVCELGAGGGGTVVLARHVPLDRLVAVKAVAASSRSALARLRREGRVLAALDHPSILKVFRLVEDGLVLALITEFLDAGNFEDALDEQRLSGPAVVDSLLHVGSALQAAHAAGIAHRDVKPSNVLLGRDGRVVLADFGLSRLGGEFRTQTGAITGTPLYMAPEQITTPDVETPGVDIYSYGALIYRALTGRPPFVAPDLETLAGLHLSAAPERLDQVRPGVPRAVSTVVLGMLAKNPQDRPALPEVSAVLRKVKPEAWDAVLPEAQAAAPRPSSSSTEAAVLGTLGGSTEGGGTTGGGTEGGDESGNTPRIPIVTDISPLLLKDVVQPVFRPRRRRKNYRILAVVCGILVGLALGLLVLLLI